MRGNTILLSCQPKGRFEGCIISGTPKPGTVMQPTSAAVSAGVGRSTYSARTGQLDGARGPVAVLLEDYLQGSGPTVAYVSGTWGQIYWPTAGDELNMILKYEPGTGTSGEELIGAFLEIVGASGKLQAKGTFNVPSGAHVSAPFEQLEQLGVALAADYLLWCRYLGNDA